MVNEVLLAAIRIEYPTLAEVRSAHSQIFAAWRARLDKVQVIVGKSNADASASGQVVVSQADYQDWLQALQARIRELGEETDGTGALFTGTEHVNFSGRYIDP